MLDPQPGRAHGLVEYASVMKLRKHEYNETPHSLSATHTDVRTMEIEFTLDGQTVHCPEGLTVAGALFHLGRLNVRVTARAAVPRSLFCGIGVCCDCLMQIDDRASVRACMTLVQPGMRVVSAQGAATVARET